MPAKNPTYYCSSSFLLIALLLINFTLIQTVLTKTLATSEGVDEGRNPIDSSQSLMLEPKIVYMDDSNGFSGMGEGVGSCSMPGLKRSVFAPSGLLISHTGYGQRPYNQSKNCVLTIAVPLGYHIRLKVLDFDVSEHSSSSSHSAPENSGESVESHSLPNTGRNYDDFSSPKNRNCDFRDTLHVFDHERPMAESVESGDNNNNFNANMLMLLSTEEDQQRPGRIIGEFCGQIAPGTELVRRSTQNSLTLWWHTEPPKSPNAVYKENLRRKESSESNSLPSPPITGFRLHWSAFRRLKHGEQCHPRTEFQCQKSQECIPLGLGCNRYADCLDESDLDPRIQRDSGCQSSASIAFFGWKMTGPKMLLVCVVAVGTVFFLCTFTCALCYRCCWPRNRRKKIQHNDLKVDVLPSKNPGHLLSLAAVATTTAAKQQHQSRNLQQNPHHPQHSHLKQIARHQGGDKRHPPPPPPPPTLPPKLHHLGNNIPDSKQKVPRNQHHHRKKYRDNHQLGGQQCPVPLYNWGGGATLMLEQTPMTAMAVPLLQHPAFANGLNKPKHRSKNSDRRRKQSHEKLSGQHSKSAKNRLNFAHFEGNNTEIEEENHRKIPQQPSGTSNSSGLTTPVTGGASLSSGTTASTGATTNTSPTNDNPDKKENTVTSCANINRAGITIDTTTTIKQKNPNSNSPGSSSSSSSSSGASDSDSGSSGSTSTTANCWKQQRRQSEPLQQQPQFSSVFSEEPLQTDEEENTKSEVKEAALMSHQQNHKMGIKPYHFQINKSKSFDGHSRKRLPHLELLEEEHQDEEEEPQANEKTQIETQIEKRTMNLAP